MDNNSQQPISPAPQTTEPQPTQPTQTIQSTPTAEPAQTAQATQPTNTPNLVEQPIEIALPKKRSSLPKIIIAFSLTAVAVVALVLALSNFFSGGTSYNASRSEISDAEADIMKYLNDHYSSDFTLTFSRSEYSANDGGIGADKSRIYFYYTATSSLLPGETFDISCIKKEAVKSSSCEPTGAQGYSAALLKKIHDIIGKQAIELLKPTISNISINDSSKLYVLNRTELNAGESNILSLTNLDTIKTLQRVLGDARSGEAAPYYAELTAEERTAPEVNINFANNYSLLVSPNSIFVIYNNDSNNKAKISSIESLRSFVTSH